MRLRERLIEQIVLEGPMSVADYVSRCLLDPIDGYYTKHVAFGETGDFITAPMVSQAFGEMIGVWAAETWTAMGRPAPFRLAEIGPGDGTLMSDILRVVARVPGMRMAMQLVLIEPSPALRTIQAARFPDARFATALDDGDAPLIVIGNEVLDCLPANQYVRGETGWHECLVGLSEGKLAFGLSAEVAEHLAPLPGQLGDFREYSPAQRRFAAMLAAHIKTNGGAALLIDYGRDVPGPGNTLQALHRHRKYDPLDAPGEHDLTQWADFPAVADAARAEGVAVSRIATQAEFLKAMGIDARFADLAARHPDKAEKLQRQYHRLMDSDEMGALFKVVAFTSDGVPMIGLEADTTAD
ncbi:class I SAM-dependent methyltransferase [Asticcacaulis solisilvae]|uniref:class I SAM-dependent methyltransferase n=1 Tax=Asticcacaulis solisilvae TaxID=1217274 RepID=UPI003FD7BC76